jgi:hypothetical protein
MNDRTEFILGLAIAIGLAIVIATVALSHI